MRRTELTRALLTAGLIVGLAACDDDGVTGPGSVPLSQDETAISVDLDLTDAVVTEAEAEIEATAAAATAGLFADTDDDALVEARELLRQARQKFAEARAAWQRGERELAGELALEGRTLVAEAMVLVFGEGAYERLQRRVRQMIAWLEERVDGEASELLSRIRALSGEAEARFGEGDLIGAVERLILARQVAGRERTHMRRDRIRAHARLALFMARAALDLAGDVVGDNPTERQSHALRHAVHTLGHAQGAFGNGRFRLGFELARETVNLSLIAVVLDPDLSDRDRVGALTRIAENAISEAERALEANPDHELAGVATQLLEGAQRTFDRATELADAQPRRAAYLLWHAASVAHGVTLLLT